VGVTDFFRDYLISFSGRSLSKYDAVFPIGYLKEKIQVIDCEVHLRKMGLSLDSKIIFSGKLKALFLMI
jgi:hypothetical protein